MFKFLRFLGVILFSILCSLSVFAQTNANHHHSVRDTIVISADSSLYEVDNLGPAINAGDLSSGPCISPDGKTLYFFKINDEKNLRHTRDIWVSTYNDKDSTWSNAVHMDDPLNNYDNNSVHSVTDSGRVLILHNRYLKNLTGKNGVSWSRIKEDKTWTFPKKVSIKKYKNVHDCSFHLSENGKVMIMAIKGKDSRGKQDLYVAQRIGDDKDDFKFGEPINLGPVINTPKGEATAFLLEDNKTLFFSSEGHPGSHGGFDIYKSTRLDTNSWTSWSKPVNIGSPFNTVENEFYFSVPDSLDYAYMARRYHDKGDSTSKSHIIRIKLKLPTTLTLVGKTLDSFDKLPINSTVKFIDLKTGKEVAKVDVQADKGYNVVLNKGTKYAMVTESPDHFPHIDTLDYTAATTKEKQSKDVELDRNYMVLHGKVLDAKTMAPISAELLIINAKTGEIHEKIHVDPSKEYQAKLPIGGEFEFKYKASAEGYLSDENRIDLSGVTKYQERAMDILLQPKRKGISFAIKNIYFETAKTDLLPASFPELDNLTSILLDAPEIKVEISGHTDDVGKDLYNMNLSQGRAESVVKYLVSKGIPQDQFVAKGYGETKPIKPNTSAANRAMNRRVEFKILEIRDLEPSAPKAE